MGWCHPLLKCGHSFDCPVLQMGWYNFDCPVLQIGEYSLDCPVLQMGWYSFDCPVLQMGWWHPFLEGCQQSTIFLIKFPLLFIPCLNGEELIQISCQFPTKKCQKNNNNTASICHKGQAKL